jgi:hypothetical protein
LLHGSTAWRWLVLFSVLPVVWFIRLQARHLQSMVVVFLDEAAEAWKLTKLGKSIPADEPPPRPAATVPPQTRAEPGA